MQIWGFSKRGTFRGGLNRTLVFWVQLNHQRRRKASWTARLGPEEAGGSRLRTCWPGTPSPEPSTSWWLKATDTTAPGHGSPREARRPGSLQAPGRPLPASHGSRCRGRPGGSPGMVPWCGGSPVCGLPSVGAPGVGVPANVGVPSVEVPRCGGSRCGVPCRGSLVLGFPPMWGFPMGVPGVGVCHWLLCLHGLSSLRPAGSPISTRTRHTWRAACVPFPRLSGVPSQASVCTVCTVCLSGGVSAHKLLPLKVTA